MSGDIFKRTSLNDYYRSLIQIKCVMILHTQSHILMDRWNIYTIGKVGNIWKIQWKHSYLTFWFAGNCLAPNTNKYGDFNAILSCCVYDGKITLQCTKLKVHNRVYGNVPFLILGLKFPITSSVSIITLQIYGNFVCIQYFVIRIIQNNNLSAKIKRAEGCATQSAVSCHLVSQWKSASFA